MTEDLRHRLIRFEVLVTVLFLTLLSLGAYGVASTVLSAGNPTGDLVAHYRFAEGAGDTAYDHSGYGNDGTKAGNVSWTTDCVTETCVYFGEDDSGRLTVPSSDSLNITGNVAFTAWVKTEDATADGDGQTIFDKVNEDDPWEGYGLNIGRQTDGHLAYWNSDEGEWVESASANYDIGEWTFIAVVHEGEEVTFYKNGEQDGTATSSERQQNSPADLIIGRSFYDGERAFNGSIDDLRIYNTSLSKDEIKSLYNQGAARFGTSPDGTGNKVLDMDFTRINDTHVFDTSGNEYHGKKIDVDQKSAGHCKVGRCYEFPEGNSGINVGNVANFEGAPNFTVMMWARPNFTDDKTEHYIDNDDSDNGWRLYGQHNQEEFSFRWRNGTDSQALGFDVENNVWQHITFTFNETHGKGYVNGVRAVTEIISVNISPSPDELFIGRSNQVWGNIVDGRIDQVKIFDRALTQQEIIKEAGIDQEGAVLDLRFDEGAGSTVYDRSIHGNDGKLEPNESKGPQWTSDCVTGMCLDFEGDEEYVEVPDDSSLQMPETLSVSTWMYSRGQNDESGSIMVRDAASGGSNTRAIQIDVLTSDRIRSYITNNTHRDTLIYEFNPDDVYDQWTNVHLNVNTTHQALYLNGNPVETAERTIGDIQYNDNPLRIGGFRPPDYPDAFNGSIDNFQIYPYTLSNDKIRELYNRGSSRIGQQVQERQPQDPGTDGLLLHHTFNNVNGTHSLDRSGLLNHGTLENDPETRPSGECIVGRCMEFVREDSSRIVGSVPDVVDASTFAWTFWVNPSSFSNFQHPFGLGSYHEATIYIPESGDIHYKFDGVFDGDRYEAGFGTMTKEDWYHVVVTYNGSEGKAYLDGREASSFSTSGTLNISSDNFVIGGAPNMANFFNGSIDDVRIYNSSLSQDEIWYLYTQGRDRLSSGEMAGPLAWWRMNAGEGDTAYDYSGEGNDGSLQNGPVWTDDCVTDSCLEFEGNGSDAEYVYVSDDSVFDDLGSITLATWVRFNNETTEDDEWLVGKTKSGSNPWSIRRRDSAGRCGGEEVSSVYVSGLAEADRWYHLVCTVNSTHVRLYIDGELGGQDTGNFNLTNSDNHIGIGGYHSSNLGLNGTLDDVRIYPYALSEEQIRQVKERGSMRIG